MPWAVCNMASCSESSDEKFCFIKVRSRYKNLISRPGRHVLKTVQKVMVNQNQNIVVWDVFAVQTLFYWLCYVRDFHILIGVLPNFYCFVSMYVFTFFQALRSFKSGTSVQMILQLHKCSAQNYHNNGRFHRLSLVTTVNCQKRTFHFFGIIRYIN